MSTEEKTKIEQLEKVKSTIENTDGPIAFFDMARGIGLSSTEANAMVKLGIVERERSKEHRLKYEYKWTGKKPSRKLYDEIYEKAKKDSRESQRKTNLRKREEKRRKEEEERTLREKKAKEIKEAKEAKLQRDSRKNEGQLLDPADTEFINKLKAQSEGLTEEDIRKLEVNGKEVEQKETKPNIPISIDVTTDGDKKTVSIKIEV